MNALAKILDAEAASAMRLGSPSADYGAHKRRMNAMATMTGMRGFSVPPLEPKTDAQGLTRGARQAGIAYGSHGQGDGISCTTVHAQRGSPSDGGGSMTDKVPVIYIHETVAKSWARDASTFALFAVLIGLGVFLESSAMQWAGAIIAFTTIAAKGSGIHKRSRMTIAQARVKLDELEAA